MPNKISKEVIGKRKERLLEVVRKEALNLREKFVGDTLDVLLETKGMGRAQNFLKVNIPNLSLRPNETVQVKCVANDQDGLVGEVI